MRRLRHLLFWQAQFDARRPMLWLAGAVYLLVAGPLLLWILWQTRGFARPSITGSSYLAGLTMVHAVLAAGVAAVRGARAADERATGFLSLVQITNFPAIQWTVFRMLAAFLAYAPLWLLRLPMYTLCLFLRGVVVSDLLAAEAMLAIVFLLSATCALHVGLFAKSTQAAMMLTGGVLIGGQMFFYAPRLLLSSVRLALGDFPASLQDAYEAALMFSQWALVPHLWNPPTALSEWVDVAPAAVVHLGASALFFLSAWWTAFVDVSDSAASGKRPTVIRPPRRVWDDALAWQAYHIHANGRRTITGKIVIYAICAVVGFTTSLAAPQLSMAMVTAMTAITLLCAASHMGENMMREARDQTLSTLAILPLDPMEFYAGWKRGVMRLTTLDHCVAALCVPIAILLAGAMLPAYLGFVVVLLLAPAFFYLNGVVRFDWAVFGLAAKVFPAMFTSLFVSIYVAAEWGQRWTALAIFCAAALATHRYILWQIPKRFLRQVEKTA